jgi:hypothetical protein
MTFREKVTRTELKALTESNPRRRLFAGVAAAEPSTQHHHSGYRKEWCLDRGGSERQKPNLVFCLLVHRQATMGRPESFHRKSPDRPLSSIISRSSLSQAIFWRARQDAHPDHDRSHRLGRGWCRVYRCGAAFERTGKCYIGSCPSCQIEIPRRAGDGKQSFVVARKLHTLILRAHELKR